MIKTARVEKLLLKYILQNHKFFKKSTLSFQKDPMIYHKFVLVEIFGAWVMGIEGTIRGPKKLKPEKVLIIGAASKTFGPL